LTDQAQTNPEKSISEQLDELLKQLSADQIRFIVARQECATDGEAAKAIGVKPDTVYHWPDIVKEAVKLMAGDGVYVARELRRRALPKAMAVKTAGLDSDNEKVRQDAATEIIEWEMGKAEQKTRVSGEVKFIWDK